MNKRAFLGLTAVAAGSALLAARAGVRAQETATIRIGTLISDTAAEPLYGVDTNMFAQAGLKVEVQPFTNYGALQGAIAGKALDVGIIDTLATAVGSSRGISIAILAAASTQIAKSPTMLLCVAKASTLRSGRELEGKTIAVASLGGSAEATLRAWLGREGVEQSKVALIEMPLAQMGPALERGTVAAAEIFEPALTVARLAGGGGADGAGGSEWWARHSGLPLPGRHECLPPRPSAPAWLGFAPRGEFSGFSGVMIHPPPAASRFMRSYS